MIGGYSGCSVKYGGGVLDGKFCRERLRVIEIENVSEGFKVGVSVKFCGIFCVG